MAMAAWALAGCSSKHADRGTTSDGGDAVVVDFYREGRPLAGCSGTLVSPLVVLTAAHCADGSDGARVMVAGDAGAVEVAQVLTYDWTDETEHHAQEHDLALLVLRAPLFASSSAWISTDHPVGGDVSIWGRSSQDGRVGLDATRTDGRIVADAAPMGRPFAVVVSPGVADAGGAVRRSDGAVVGVVMGKGQNTGVGYVARLDEALVASWVKGVTSGVVEGTEHPGALPKMTIGGSVRIASVAHDGELLGGSGDLGTMLASAEPLEERAQQLLNRPAAPASYNAPGIQVSDPSLGLYDVKTGTNYWAALWNLPRDNAFQYASSVAASTPNANFIFAHGEPGYMDGLPPMSEVAALFARNPGLLVLGSCFGGALYRGTSNASRIADASGIRRQAVYACTGRMLLFASEMDCGGVWVDGTQQPISPEQRGGLLRNCTLTTTDGTNYRADGCQ
jgi:hypothetical protein